MPREPPFDKAKGFRPTFDTKGFSGEEVEYITRAFRHMTEKKMEPREKSPPSPFDPTGKP